MKKIATILMILVLLFTTGCVKGGMVERVPDSGEAPNIERDQFVEGKDGRTAFEIEMKKEIDEAIKKMESFRDKDFVPQDVRQELAKLYQEMKVAELEVNQKLIEFEKKAAELDITLPEVTLPEVNELTSPFEESGD